MAITSPPEAGGASGEAYRDFEHVGPGTLAGRFFRRFWHPVYRSEELEAGRAKPVRILGEDFTLYRGEGGDVHAVGFRCAHRGTQMSTGWVEGDNLRCFYHGWVYGPDGQCVEQPAEPEPFCNRIKIRSYPVQEYLGLIFVYQGEGEPPPMRRFAVGESASLVESEMFTWPYNYYNHFDNRMDYAHQPFVHQRGGAKRRARNQSRGSRGTGITLSGFPTISLQETDWGYTGVRSYETGVTRIEHIVMPNIHLHKSRPGNPRPEDPARGWRDTLRWIVPVDDEHFTEVSVYLADATPEEIATYREVRNEVVEKLSQVPVYELVQAVLQGRMTTEELAEYDMHGGSLQDAVAQWGQGTFADRGNERLGQSDASPVFYRQLISRELRALAEGAPLKEWNCPPELHADWD
jgi:5,5'-dehydrodivanillate O-demethylase oxygenase subunit